VTVALQLLGAVAGISALSSAVGGAMLWLRLNALNLPGDESVSVLPKGLLLTVGLHALALPVCFGVLAGLAFAFAKPKKEDGKPHWWRLGVVSALTLIPAAIAVIVATWHMRWVPERFLVFAAGALALAAIVFTALEKSSVNRLAWTVGVGFVLCASVLVVSRTRDHPTLAPIAVISDAGKYATSGFYIGETRDRLYLAPLPGGGQREYAFADSPADRILVLPRETIVKMTISEPVGIQPEDPGRDQASTLLANLQSEGIARVAARIVRTRQPELAFAPIVNLQAQENLWPMTADQFLAHADLYWRAGKGCKPVLVSRGPVDPKRLTGDGAYRHAPVGQKCGPGPAPNAFAADAHTRPYDRKNRPAELPVDQGFYLDLDDHLRKGTTRLDQEGAQTFIVDAPVYYERDDNERIRGRKAVRITYWFFYGLSRPPGPEAVTSHFVHEGDWERISVLLRPRGNGRYLPDSVRFHSHDSRRDVPWSEVNTVGVRGGPATHPVVYDARGSHASYARAGRYPNDFKPGPDKIVTVDDEAFACPRCPQWRTWRRLVEATSQPWYGYGGAWGYASGDTGTTGPLGPSRYKSSGLSPSPNSTVPPPVPEATVVK
jgi:hypothetical protein